MKTFIEPSPDGKYKQTQIISELNYYGLGLNFVKARDNADIVLEVKDCRNWQNGNRWENIKWFIEALRKRGRFPKPKTQEGMNELKFMQSQSHKTQLDGTHKIGLENV